GCDTVAARLVSLQPLQHLDPGAHCGNVQEGDGTRLRAGRPVGRDRQVTCNEGPAQLGEPMASVDDGMSAKEFDAKEFVSSLPRRPGVYRMYNSAHELLYVGKARNLRDRVGTYFAASNVNPKVQALVAQIGDIEVTVANSETEALLLEYNLIKAHKPRFNVVLRDD